MDLDHPIFYILNFVCMIAFCVLWLSAGVMLNRLMAHREARRLQSRIETWASARGWRIVGQERPPWKPHAASNVFPWLFTPSDSLWLCDVRTRGLIGVCTLATCVAVNDGGNRLRRGRIEYEGMPIFGWSAEPLWEETPEDSPLTPPHTAAP